METTDSQSLLVVKIGGGLGDIDAALTEIAARTGPTVLVHGAHAALDDLSARLGHPPRFVTSTDGASSRYTDAVTMDHFLMAYCGVANKRIVERLQQMDCNAVGLSGIDGAIARGQRRATLRARDGDRVRALRDDHTGRIDTIDARLPRLLLDAGYVPVLTPPALSTEGVAINVDGDRFAAELAVALGATQLVILSDIPGVLGDPADPSTLIRDIWLDDTAAARTAATGRFRAKVEAVISAVTRGVEAAVIGDGRGPTPLAAALSGGGTWIRDRAVAHVAGPSAPQSAQ